MNFSELFKQSNNLCSFSYNGNHLASAVQHRLTVRDVKTLSVVQVFNCEDDIELIEWSSDSILISCAMFKHAKIQVWSVEDPSWVCKIDEGSAGLINFKWAPDSRHILSTAEFHVRITVWSLVNKSVSYIKHPKPVEMNTSFSQNGNYLALLERRSCKDFVSVFSCSSWQLLKHFEPDTIDAAGISFAPDGNCMCIWESLFEYKIALYSLSGHCIATFVADDWTLGIKTVSWSLSSQFLAIGDYDSKVHVLNHIIWRPVAEFEPIETLENSSVVIYKEIEKCWGHDNGARLESFVSSKYDIILDRPLSIPVTKSESSKTSLRFGISHASFSADNRYLMVRNDNMPTSLWIWSIKDMELVTILIQIRPIKFAYWDPIKSRLALCTGSNKLYMWSPEGSTAVEVPNQVSFEVCCLSWHPAGDCVLLMGKDQMCLCFIQN